MKNICKLIPHTIGQGLETMNFVLETDPDVMKQNREAPTHRLMLVSSGRGVLCADGEALPISAGELVFVFRGQEFFSESKENLQYIYVDFDGALSDELFRRFAIDRRRCRFPGHEALIPVFKESLVRADGKNTDILSLSMLFYAFSFLSEAGHAPDDLLHRVFDYTDEHFTEPTLTLSSLAAALGYSEKYLSHYFRTQMKIGYTEYLKNRRLSHAQLLIRQGVTTVRNVALLSGYADPLYFSRVFRQEFGTSPKEYIAKTNG